MKSLKRHTNVVLPLLLSTVFLLCWLQQSTTVIASSLPAQNSLPSPSLASEVILSKTSTEDLASVIARIDSGALDKVYVYSAIDVETPTSVTPSILSGIYSEKLDYAATPQRRHRLLSMLKALKLSSYQGQPETKVGLVLVDSASTWQYTIFCDEFGKLGSVGGKSVRMNDSFIQFVRSLFAPLNGK